MTKSSEVLMSRPLTGTGQRTEVKYWRNNDDYQNKSGDFVLPPGQARNYSRQYFHIYRHRLEALRQRVVDSARSHFGPDVVIKNLCDLDKELDSQETEGEMERLLVVGTLFKHQPLKPNILQELSEDNAIQTSQAGILNRKSKFISEQDEIILEDELQRIKLLPAETGSKGSFSVAGLPTGVVCGVYGRMGLKADGDGGKFFVEDVVFPRTPGPTTTKKEEEATDRYIVIMSGLNLRGCGSEGDGDVIGPLELAVSWLTGEGGDMTDQERISRVDRVIVAGDSLAEETRDNDASVARYLTKNKEASSIDAVNALDGVLARLADSVQVDLMPGPNDPANQSLPQQPLHKCLFPKTGVYPTFHNVPNPYHCSVDAAVEVVGTSGQNLTDLMSNTDLEDPVEGLECLLRWGHLVPTSPDTLGCYPFQDADPFVVDTRPSVFFAANQKSFGQRLIKNEDGSSTLCLAVPKFSETSEVCLVNTRTLECETISFKFELS